MRIRDQKGEQLNVHFDLDEAEYQLYATEIKITEQAILTQYNNRFELLLKNTTLTFDPSKSAMQFSYKSNNDHVKLFLYHEGKWFATIKLMLKVNFLTSAQIKGLIKRVIEKRGFRKKYIASELGISVSSLLKWSQEVDSTPCKKVYVTVMKQMIAGK